MSNHFKMKQKIFSISLLLLLAFVGFVSAETCSDTDGGLDYYTKGIITVGDDVAEDVCSESGFVKEYSCSLPENDYYDNYYCENGCEDGACVEEAETCSDTDNGLDYYTKGIITVGDDVAEDVCSESGFVKEYSCSLPENDYYDNYYCENGCEDGACVEEAETCSDTDGGLDYYTKGIITVGDDVAEDVCSESGFVKEYSCSLPENDYYDNYYCENGCEDGACVVEAERDSMDSCLDKPKKYWDQKTEKCYDYSLDSIKELCDDSDGGKKPYILAHTFGFRGYSSADDPSRDLRIRTGGKDSCLDDNTLREHYCSKEGYISSYELECEFGCSNGMCVGTEEKIEAEEKPLNLPEDDLVNQIVYVCEGCEKDEKCYPFNYRKGGEYCNIEQDFISQLEADSTCENNFECSSNLCIDDQCISSGFWQKIMNWFKNLFG